MFTLGDTFLAPKTSYATEHLWIVITEPQDNKAVCVNVTSSHSFAEKTTVLNVGDHPFIKHESVIRYSDAKLIDLKAVEAAIAARQMKFVCKQLEPCSEELLKRIQEGLLKSKQVSKEIRTVCENAWKSKA